MSVFRVEKTSNYTVMSNYHLRDKSLSLKAKGLLSQMLSLPEDWDYTLNGLAIINREKIDAIRQAVRELEKAGYILRSRERDKKGCLRGTVYVIYEQPQAPSGPDAPEHDHPALETPTLEKPTLENPTLDNPTLDNPTLDNPTLGKPTLENPMQLNIDIQSKDGKNKDSSSTESIPLPSPPPAGTRVASPPERKRREASSQKSIELYRSIIMENIGYDHLLRLSKTDQAELDGIVELMVETVCTARRTIRVAGDDFPSELVKSRLLKLNEEHVSYVLDCMRENTTKIRNIKKYLLAALFNAPTTISSYYTSLAAHDMAESLPP